MLLKCQALWTLCHECRKDLQSGCYLYIPAVSHEGCSFDVQILYEQSTEESGRSDVLLVFWWGRHKFNSLQLGLIATIFSHCDQAFVVLVSL